MQVLLREAARRGDANQLRRLLTPGIGPGGVGALRLTDEHGDTLLHDAVRRGRLAAVDLLVDRGAPLEARNRWRLTPLHCAVEYAREDCVRRLLERGALPDARRWDGSTALMAALSQRASAATGDGRATALAMAQVLIGYGADVNARDDAGRSPLVYGLTDAGARELVLAAGADVNAADRTGRTCLMRAVLRCDLPLVEALLAAGADVNAVDNEGYTPLMLLMLARLQSHALLRTLLQAGADVNARSCRAETVLTLAAVRGKSWWAVEELRAHGARA
jgi:FOG: Ankyrin repeat